MKRMKRTKRTVWSIVLAGLAFPALAHAGHFDTSAPPLADVLARARAGHKPVLLDFSTVW
jgi:hypothetical protein